MPPTRYAIDADLDVDLDVAPAPRAPPPPLPIHPLDEPGNSAAALGSSSSSSGGGGSTTALAALTSHWLAQRSAPELLPYPSNSIATLLSQMDQQQSILDSLSTLPPSDDAQEMEDEHLRLQCVLLDLERARWLLRSYLRCRLGLIEKNAAWLVQERERGEGRARLSNVEWQFCKRYNELRQSHLESTVLQFLPEPMRGMEDKAINSTAASGKGDMVERPDLDAPVFVRCLEECGNISLPDGETANLAKDSVHFLRYRSIRHLVAQHRVQLV